jgi:hypothetical protein
LSTKFCKKYSIQNATVGAIKQVDLAIDIQSKYIENLFQNIKVIESPNIVSEKRNLDDVDTCMQPSKRCKSLQNRTLQHESDNKRCKKCLGDFGHLCLNEEQDWVYQSALRVNDSIYCSLRCVQYSLVDIECEQPTRNQEDNAICPKCARFIPYYQEANFVWYYNDFSYDGSCGGVSVQGCDGKSCATLRLNDLVYCNAKCAGLTV